MLGLTFGLTAALWWGLERPGYIYTVDNIMEAPAVRNPLTGRDVNFVELLRRDSELQDVRFEAAKKKGFNFKRAEIKRGC